MAILDNPIASAVNTILDRVIPDRNARAAANVELDKMKLSGELAAVAGQVEVNKVEAASQSTFVAGWRPMIGWICGAGLSYTFVTRPLLTFTVQVFGGHAIAPALDMSELTQLLLGMLGLAGMRTYEKVQGINAGK